MAIAVEVCVLKGLQKGRAFPKLTKQSTSHKKRYSLCIADSSFLHASKKNICFQQRILPFAMVNKYTKEYTVKIYDRYTSIKNNSRYR